MYAVLNYKGAYGLSFGPLYGSDSGETAGLSIPVSGDQLGGYMVVENNAVDLAAV